jgi:hypothetical protein
MKTNYLKISILLALSIVSLRLNAQTAPKGQTSEKVTNMSVETVNNGENVKTNINGKLYEMKFIQGQLSSLSIDGENIKPEQWGIHNKAVMLIQNQIKRDKAQFRIDQEQFKKDQEQFAKDQAQYKLDAAQHAKDTEQFKKDQEQFKLDAIQHTKDQVQFAKDQVQYKLDAAQHTKETAQFKKDQETLKRDMKLYKSPKKQ